MDLVALEDFVSVVRAGSFAAAARLTRTPKSTLSKRVQDLEASLGQRLVERTTRALRLTPEGALLLERGERLLAEAAELERLVRNRDATPRGRLRVAVPVLFGQSFMGELSVAYAQAWPETRIEVVFTDRLVDLVEEDFDCAIRVGMTEDVTLVARTFARSYLRVVASPDLVARLPGLERPEDLNGWPTIALSVAGGPEHWSLEHGEARVEIRHRAVISLNNVFAVRAAARAGGGAAMIPEFVVADDLRSGALVPVLDVWRSPPVDLRLLHPKRREPSARVRAFVETVAARFPDHRLDGPGPRRP